MTSGLKAVLKNANMTQNQLAARSGVPQPRISQVVNGKPPSVPFAKKTARHLGVGEGVLFGGLSLNAIVRAVEEGAMDEATGADKLMGLVRKLIEHFEGMEDEEGGEELIDAIEQALASLTGAAVDTVRGGKGAGVAAKNAHPLILRAIDRVGTGATDPTNYEVNDSRDAFGRKVKLLPEDYGNALDADDLADDEEHGFPDPASFGSANVSHEYDNLPTDAYGDGRDLWGRRNRPLERS